MAWWNRWVEVPNMTLRKSSLPWVPWASYLYQHDMEQPFNLGLKASFNGSINGKAAKTFPPPLLANLDVFNTATKTLGVCTCWICNFVSIIPVTGLRSKGIIEVSIPKFLASGVVIPRRSTWWLCTVQSGHGAGLLRFLGATCLGEPGETPFKCRSRRWWCARKTERTLQFVERDLFVCLWRSWACSIPFSAGGLISKNTGLPYDPKTCVLCLRPCVWL